MTRLRTSLLPIALVAAFFLHACDTAEQAAAVPDERAEARLKAKATNDSILRDVRQTIAAGDLILRTGRGFDSEFIKDLNQQDKTWSHAGIVTIDSGNIYVYHIEPDNHHVNDKVRREPLDSFCAISRNLGIGLARFTLNPEEKQQFLTYLDEQYHKQVAFDMTFNMQTNDSMYCSEMISKGLAHATNNKIVISTDRMRDRNKLKVLRKFFKTSDKVITSRDVIFIDHLFLNPYCTVLKRYTYLDEQ